MKRNGIETEWIINKIKSWLKGTERTVTERNETEWIIDQSFWAYYVWNGMKWNGIETERISFKKSKIETERNGTERNGNETERIEMEHNGTERNEMNGIWKMINSELIVTQRKWNLILSTTSYQDRIKYIEGTIPKTNGMEWNTTVWNGMKWNERNGMKQNEF